VRNSSNTFLASSQVMQSTQPSASNQPNCGTQCWSPNVCSVGTGSGSCRGHTSSSSRRKAMHLQALDLRVCQPNRPLALLLTHIPLQYVNFLSVKQQLLFYSYVFRPHRDKTIFKLRRCKTQNLPSKWLHALSKCEQSP